MLAATTDILLLLLTIIGALLGGSLGSFSGLVLDRKTRGISFIKPRSACANCATPIAWHDNIPVLAFLALSGRCRSCRASIPKLLFVYEAIGACMGAALAFTWVRQFR